MLKKILIVDDEPNIVKTLQSRLSFEKYGVVTAVDGLDGYEKAVAEQPDLIILDALMPGLTGYELVKKLRERDDKLAHIPIIVITARPSIKKFFSVWQIHGFLGKPFRTEDLLAQVHRFLRDTGEQSEHGTDAQNT